MRKRCHPKIVFFPFQKIFPCEYFAFNTIVSVATEVVFVSVALSHQDFPKKRNSTPGLIDTTLHLTFPQSDASGI